MIFPEEIWNIIREFLLVKLDGFLWVYLRLFQRDGFALQCHMYYRILRTERSEIISKMAEIGFSAMCKLENAARRSAMNDIYYASHAVDDENRVWSLFEEDSLISFQCVKVLRIINTFSDICTYAPIKTLLEMLYHANKNLEVGIKMFYVPTCVENCYRTIYNNLHSEVRSQNRIKFVWKPDYSPPQIKLTTDIP